MQPLHALKKRPAPLGRRPDGTPGRPMAVAVAWYGGLREMIYIYRLFVKFIVLRSGVGWGQNGVQKSCVKRCSKSILCVYMGADFLYDR